MMAEITEMASRLAIGRWASGGIILSSVATRYQLGLLAHAAHAIDKAAVHQHHVHLLKSTHDRHSCSPARLKRAGIPMEQYGSLT
jgi:hypothetical protein